MVTEKEFLAIIYAINKFWHYITGYPTFAHNDHTTIRYIINKPITLGRITRLLLLIQEFDITIIDKPRKDNVVTDFLPCLNISDEGARVEYSFQDEHFFSISTHTSWYTNISNYHDTWKVAQFFPYK